MRRLRGQEGYVTTDMLLDLIYQRADQLMKAGRIEELDKMFRFEEKTDLNLMIGLLTASLPVRSKLPSRPAYFKAVAELCVKLGETDPTLLQGLE